MDRYEIKDKLSERISKLTDGLPAQDIADWYLKLGSVRLVTILRELIDEEKCLSQHILCENERKLMDIKIAKNNLDKVVGE